MNFQEIRAFVNRLKSRISQDELEHFGSWDNARQVAFLEYLFELQWCRSRATLYQKREELMELHYSIQRTFQSTRDKTPEIKEIYDYSLFWKHLSVTLTPIKKHIEAIKRKHEIRKLQKKHKTLLGIKQLKRAVDQSDPIIVMSSLSSISMRIKMNVNSRSSLTKHCKVY
jgi:hypothetical protein